MTSKSFTPLLGRVKELELVRNQRRSHFSKIKKKLHLDHLCVKTSTRFLPYGFLSCSVHRPDQPLTPGMTLAYHQNAKVPHILAEPMSMEPVQPQGSLRRKSLSARVAHPLVVLAHTLACIRRSHHVAELHVPAQLGDDLLAPRSHQQLSSFGTSLHLMMLKSVLSPPRLCAAPSARSNARSSGLALAAMRPENWAWAEPTQAITCGTPSLNLMLSLEICSPSCAADRCAQQMIRMGSSPRLQAREIR